MFHDVGTGLFNTKPQGRVDWESKSFVLIAPSNMSPFVDIQTTQRPAEISLIKCVPLRNLTIPRLLLVYSCSLRTPCSRKSSCRMSYPLDGYQTRHLVLILKIWSNLWTLISIARSKDCTVRLLDAREGRWFLIFSGCKYWSFYSL